MWSDVNYTMRGFDHRDGSCLWLLRNTRFCRQQSAKIRFRIFKEKIHLIYIIDFSFARSSLKILHSLKPLALSFSLSLRRGSRVPFEWDVNTWERSRHLTRRKNKLRDARLMKRPPAAASAKGRSVKNGPVEEVDKEERGTRSGGPIARQRERPTSESTNASLVAL